MPIAGKNRGEAYHSYLHYRQGVPIQCIADAMIMIRFRKGPRRLAEALLLLWVSLALQIGFNTVPTAYAGSVAASVERSVARKLGQRAEVAAVSAAERAAAAKLLRELDKKSLAAIQRRYGMFITQERLGIAARHPTAIMDRAAFDKHLRSQFPSLNQAEREGVLGYYFDQRLYVNGNHVQVPLTVVHERLHQLAHPRFRETLGKELNEGLTEQFARGIYSDLALVDVAKVYPGEQRIVSMLTARVGDERLASAYFKGDLGALRRFLDADLGAGTFQRFATAGRAGNLKAAEALLR